MFPRQIHNNIIIKHISIQTRPRRSHIEKSDKWLNMMIFSGLDDFDKMGYKQRLELKESNPELFNKYNK